MAAKETGVNRIFLGGFAGIAATVAMTMAMRRLHPLLEDDKRYPLPPRQIIDQFGLGREEEAARSRTVIGHLAYGAFTGALFAALPKRRGAGISYGLAVWAASYLGWIPALGVLSPASRHPTQRNLLMSAVHVVWGTVLAKSLYELEASRDDVFGRSTPANRHNEPELNDDAS